MGSLGLPRVGRVRPSPLLAPAPSDLRVHPQALGHGAGLLAGDGLAGQVAPLVGAVVSGHDPDAACQGGGHRAEGLGVVASAFDHQAPVEVGQLGLELAGHVGGQVQGPAQHREAGLGDIAVPAGLAGGVLAGDQVGVGAEGGQVGEPLQVAHRGADDRGHHGADPRDGQKHIIVVLAVVQLANAGLQAGSLGLQAG